MKKLAFLLLFLLLTLPVCALSEDTQDVLYAVKDSDNNPVFSFFGQLSEGDEYISGGNILYRVSSAEGGKAVAERVGEEPMPDISWMDAGEAQAVFASQSIPAASSNSDNRKLIAMYVTHSDESYIPTDGTQSINGQGGIYDVARSFRDELQALGVDVILDESTHLPHDSGAYRRSRQTAERLLQKRPDAIIDIHRDGIPDKNEYTCTIEGDPASQVRLLVGRSNQNSEVNREFAKQLKAVADKKYPGLIKDIFIGKGNYNQDLSPNAILLEFGTHTLSKERALESTQFMANVVNTALYGQSTGSAKAESAMNKENASAAGKEKNKGIMTGIAGLIIAAVLGCVIYALLQTGGGKAMSTKIKRGVSEITGGMLGNKPDKND